MRVSMAINDLLPKLARLATASQYTAAFFCENVGPYQTNETRFEELVQAQCISDSLRIPYAESSLPLYFLSAIPVEE